MSNLRFYERGLTTALFDADFNQIGDVPAQITATYSSPPTAIEMEHYWNGYVEGLRKKGVAEEVIKFEQERFLGFLAGSGCEARHFFGRVDPREDRAGTSKHRYGG